MNITKEHIEQKVNEAYGFMFESELIKEIAELGTYRTVHSGEMLIDIGEKVSYMPLLIHGAIKIMREDDKGDELLLYFLERGDTCAMTMACCLGTTKSEIRAVAERDTEIVMIPVQKMDEWTKQYDSWRSFVFESYSSRLSEMLEAIDNLAFLNMHDRTFKYLIDKVKINKSTEIHNTHQQIAQELHTSRVVISRILKQLENEGKIALHRNKIEVLDF